MTQIRYCHQRAMYLADCGDEQSRTGHQRMARSLWARACREESCAAMMARRDAPGSLSSSVLFRSSASLAVQARLWFQAARLIRLGLAETPPVEIVAELLELRRSVLTRGGVTR